MKPTAREIFNCLIPADKEKVTDFLRMNYTSRKIFRHDFTEHFLGDLDDRRDSIIKKHLVITCFGFTGSYKSGIMIEIARRMDKNFSVSKIAFTNQELLNLVEHEKRKGFILRDEITEEYGIGSQRQSAFLQMQAETLRASQISFGYVSPRLKRIGTEHYIIHTIGHNNFKIDDEGNALEPVYVLVGVMNPMTDNYLGGAVIEIEWMNEVWKKYVARKESFMKMVEERQFAKEDFNKLALKCLKNPKAKYAKRKYDWMLIIQESVPSLTTEEMRMLYSRIIMMGREKNGEVNEDYTPED